MAIRRDGINTRERLLEAASEVFARHGFRDTTVVMICNEAQANMAAINYHFGSKEELYAEVWQRAWEDVQHVYPIDGGLPPTASPKKRLHAVVLTTLRRILVHGSQSRHGRLLLQDFAQPVEAISNVKNKAIMPIRKHIGNIIRELLGDQAEELDVRYCQVSLMHQCLAIGFRGGKKPPPLGKGPFTEDEIVALAEHITRFSLAGICAVSRHAERRKKEVTG